MALELTHEEDGIYIFIKDGDRTKTYIYTEDAINAIKAESERDKEQDEGAV
tara:strand:- start:16 stop:168 length:153 start_codon:yes stop_codon:yes gene_type:complete